MQTPREQLAAALKKARLSAGYSTHGALANHLMMARSTITKAESPTQPAPGEALLTAWADATGVAAEEFTNLIQRAKSGTPDWFVPYKQAEMDATYLRFWEPALFPGLVQTEAYAMALERSEEVVRQRLERQQQVLGRALVMAVIDHRVLAHAIGTPAVMAEQCGHLAALVESEKVKLHLAPEGANTGLGGGMAILSKHGHVTVSLTTSTQDITTTDAKVVEANIRLFDELLGMALAPVPSLEYVRHMEETWKAR